MSGGQWPFGWFEFAVGATVLGGPSVGELCKCRIPWWLWWWCRWREPTSLDGLLIPLLLVPLLPFIVSYSPFITHVVVDVGFNFGLLWGCSWSWSPSKSELEPPSSKSFTPLSSTEKSSTSRVRRKGVLEFKQFILVCLFLHWSIYGRFRCKMWLSSKNKTKGKLIFIFVF